MQDADTDVQPNDGLAEAMAMIPREPDSSGDDGGDKAGEEAGQPRDEHGRFTKAEAEAEAARVEAEKASKGDDDRDGGQIPSWRLREIREERDRIAAREAEKDRELEALRRERAQWLQRQRQQQEAEEPPPRPDLLNEPDQFADYIQSLVDRGIQAERESRRNDWVNLTFHQEHEAHGETFEKAMKALEDVRSPQAVAEIREAVNPGKALMRWYREHTARQEIGGDLDGYKKRLRDEFKKDPEFRKEFMADLEAEARGSNGAGRSSENVTSLPSLNRASGKGGNVSQQPGSLGSTDREIFDTLTRPRRA